VKADWTILDSSTDFSWQDAADLAATKIANELNAEILKRFGPVDITPWINERFKHGF
jgi:hypothetical protein